jgi:hypothetical protein
MEQSARSQIDKLRTSLKKNDAAQKIRNSILQSISSRKGDEKQLEKDI